MSENFCTKGTGRFTQQSICSRPTVPKRQKLCKVRGVKAEIEDLILLHILSGEDAFLWLTCFLCYK